MKKYNLVPQAQQVLTKILNYELSESSLRVWKRKGFIKPAGVEKNELSNRENPYYNEKSINDFVEFYRKAVETGRIRQWATKKIPQN